MYQIRVSSFSEILAQWPEFSDLYAKHWAEIDAKQHKQPPEPDVERYKAFDRNGILLCLSVTDDSGLLIGYSISLIMHHAHYANLLVCSNDMIFIDTQHRKGRLGLQLINETEKHATARGAQKMIWTGTPDSPLISLMLCRGCDVLEIAFSKEL